MNLVTGGAGFIGSHLVRELLARGESVRVLERPGACADHLPLERIELVQADIRDRDAVCQAVAGCRRVYHLAANPRLWAPDPREFDAVNHRGTVHVLEEALAAGAERILHTSTESILISRRDVPGPVENFRPREEEMLGPYCKSKWRAEDAAFRLADAGRHVIVVSPTLPVGPGDWGRSPPTQMTVAFCSGRLPAYLDCRLNLIDVRDVALGMVLALERGRPGRRYLLGAHNVWLRQWLAILARHLGRPAPQWQVPYPLAVLVAHASQWAARWTGRPPLATVTGVRLTRYSMHFDPSTPLAELGLVPRSLEDSIRDALAWYRSVGWLG